MTSGKEDYLKAIYLLSENHDIVTNKELSQTLQVSPPSVSEMITKLQKQGYVDYTAYKGSKMTRKGRKEAGRLLRYHALWEVFLVNYLHFSWSQAHEMAEGLEHQTNDILSEKLEDYLNHPTHCPHGDPIPRKDGSRLGITSAVSWKTTASWTTSRAGASTLTWKSKSRKKNPTKAPSFWKHLKETFP